MRITGRNWRWRKTAGVLAAAIILGSGLVSASLRADEIQLGDFPRGQWLDTNWQAYWTFGDNTIELRDVKDKVMWDFAGIVSRQQVDTLANGNIRLSFACAKAGRTYVFEKVANAGPMLMQIRRSDGANSYRMELPLVSASQLSDYKAAVVAKKAEAVTAIVAAIAREQALPAAPSEDQLLKQADELLALAAGADFDKLELAAAEADRQGLIGQVIQKLEAQAARPDAPPQVFVALSVLYGRKGLKTQQYAALELAEKAPQPPGVAFNIALVHGRKRLLAGAPDAKDFMVGELELAPNADGAAVRLDGTDMGKAPLVLRKVAAGVHQLELSAEGYEPWRESIELGVGQSRRLAVEMAAKPCYLSYTMDTGDTGGADLTIDGEPAGDNPVALSPGSHKLEITNPNCRTISETITLKPGQTLARSWQMEVQPVAWSFKSNLEGATVFLDGVSLGTAPVESTLLPGKHQVVFRHRDRQDVVLDGQLYLAFAGAAGTTMASFPFIIPTKTIKIDGDNGDWADVPGPEGNVYNVYAARDPKPKLPGHHITRFRMCQDLKYLYWYMEFDDGKPSYSNGITYSVQITSAELAYGPNADLKIQNLRLLSSTATSWKPQIGVRSGSFNGNYRDYWGDQGSTADFRVGANFIEARFPRAETIKAIKEDKQWFFKPQTYVDGKEDGATNSGMRIRLVRLK
jgi:hypothetical protein